jgi:hypothetical protein
MTNETLSRSGEDIPEYHDRHTGMTRPVLAYAGLPSGTLKDLSPADRIISGIAWLADNSEYGIDDAAKKLIDEFRAFTAQRSEMALPDGAKLYLEHGWLTIRNETGWRLWSSKGSRIPESGFLLSEVLKEALAEASKWAADRHTSKDSK